MKHKESSASFPNNGVAIENQTTKGTSGEDIDRTKILKGSTGSDISTGTAAKSFSSFVIKDVMDRSGADESTAVTEASTAANSTSSKRSERKSNGTPSRKGKGFTGKNVPWDAGEGDFDSDGEWAVDDFGKESPSVWDPESFDKQTGSKWKEKKEDRPERLQDLPSPAVADPPPGVKKSNSDEEWPFKSPCSFASSKKGRSRTPRSGDSDIDSVGSKSAGSKGSKGSKSSRGSKSASRSGSHSSSLRRGKRGEVMKGPNDSTPAALDAWRKREAWKNNNTSVVAERRKELEKSSARPENEEVEETVAPMEAWRKRESWKNSRHSAHSKDSEKSKDSIHKPRKVKDSDSTGSGRPDADASSADRPSRTSRKHRGTDDDQSSESMDETGQSSFHNHSSDADKSKSKSASRNQSNSSIESEDSAEDIDGLGKGSFHGLVADADKPKSKTKSGRRGRRRPTRDKDEGGEEPGDFYEEIVADDTAPSGRRADLKKKKSWRERRAANRLANSGHGIIEGDPSSMDRRSALAKKGALRRAQSERWKTAVEGEDPRDIDDVQRRARSSLMNANAELSRSAHSAKRHGGFGALDRRTYHAMDRRARKRSGSIDSLDTGGSFHNDYEGFDRQNLSGHSSRTLDSAEDYEDYQDYQHMAFQTPGMRDYDEEIIELMQRANPEDTVQLAKRVNRVRGRLAYDQNMPMMTRQALLTRQASSRVMRGRVDTSNMDRRRLMLRADSTNSMHSTDELSFSQHRARISTTPGGSRRRAPPRSRSSGLKDMDVPHFMRQPPRQSGEHDPNEDRRQLFRTRSTNTSSFRQYLNKPNKVAQLSGRRPGEAIEPHSMRGSTSASSKEPSRGSLQRAKSTTALRRSEHGSSSTAGRLATRGVPSSVTTGAQSPKEEQMPDLKSTSSDSEDEKRLKKAKARRGDVSEDSSVESMERSPGKPRRKNSKSTPPKSPPPPKGKSARSKSPKRTPSSATKATNKRDMIKAVNRRKLHAILYEQKMSVNMKDLIKEAKKAETAAATKEK